MRGGCGGAESQLKARMLDVGMKTGGQRQAGKKKREKKGTKKVGQVAATKLGVLIEAAVHRGFESLRLIELDKH